MKKKERAEFCLFLPPTKTVTFGYDHPVWKDVLTSYNGEPVTYDAYGNFSINTPDNSVGSTILAMFMLALNPLSCRGYLYTPGIGVSYYLGSRFYSPQICRFMNADVYQDTGTGAVGTNMFAYCDNNPINMIDPSGTISIKLLFIKILPLPLKIYFYDGDNGTHIDIAFCGTIYSYGTNGAKMVNKIIGTQGYYYVYDKDLWLESQKKSYNSIKNTSLRTTQKERTAIYNYVNNFYSRGKMIEVPTSNSKNKLYKVTSGNYATYYLLGTNCATFVRDFLVTVMTTKFNTAMKNVYGSSCNISTLITPKSIYNTVQKMRNKI